MPFKPNRRDVENYLSNLTIGIIFSPLDEVEGRLAELRQALDIAGERGYQTHIFEEIYDELINEYVSKFSLENGPQWPVKKEETDT